MRVLLVDNHDSYTYNLFQLIASTYGVEPTVLTNDDPALAEVDADTYDAVVLSPGPGRPQTPRDVGAGPTLVRRLGLPVLGVCLGHQLLGMLADARVEAAPTPRHGHLERISHDGAGLFHGLPQGFTGVRYHSLCVADPVPAELEVTARGADGVIMALRHRSMPWWGVQFHPESVATEYGARLLENFRRMATGHSAEKATHAGWRVHARQARTGSSAPSAERLFDELFAAQQYGFWLDSSRVEPGLSRWSFLGDPGGPCGEILTADAASDVVRVMGSGGQAVEHRSIFDALGERLADRASAVDHALPVTPAGGYVGWFGYEMKAECGSPNQHVAATPDAVWMSVSRLLAVDHQAGNWWVLGLCDGDSAHCAQVEAWVETATAAVENSSGATDCVASVPIELLDPQPWLNRSREHYIKDIAQCQQALRAGESYEICLTAELELPFDGEPLAVYRRLRALNPAPYSAYLRAADVHVLCSSPERFLRVDRDGTVESKPIKGTAPRAADPVLDEQLRTELAASAKTRAENLMIVDLVRNDLGRVGVVGSVEVPELMHVESYATVHQLVSTVRGSLREGCTALDAVRACFPGGSMTGAPKERTMEIISELEDRARGVYSGTLGFLEPGGAADLNIVIRTIVVQDGTLTIGAGGAIVLDSDPDDEFDEALVKAAASLRAVAPGEVGVQRVSAVPDGDAASPAATSANRATNPLTQASSKRSLA